MIPIYYQRGINDFDRPDLLELLLDVQAHINHYDNRDVNALLYASMGYNCKMVQYLLTKRYDVNVQCIKLGDFTFNVCSSS